MLFAFCKLVFLYYQLKFVLCCVRFIVKVCVINSSVFIHSLQFIQNKFIRRQEEVVDSTPDSSSIRIVDNRIVFPDNHLYQEDEFIVLEQWQIVCLPDSTDSEEASRSPTDRVANRNGGGSRYNTKIGLVIDVINRDGYFAFCIDILMDVDVFFAFPTRLTKTYLISLAEDGEEGTVILARDLERVLEVTGIYDVLDPRMVLTTYWIRIVQRRWKRVFAEKQRRLLMRGTIMAQRRFELTGTYGIDMTGLSIKGMMSLPICQESTNIKIG